jgi:hypothetical protein
MKTKDITDNDLERVWLTREAVHIRTRDGREAKELFAHYKRLAGANAKKLHNFKINAFGLHWPDLDEDLSYNGFFAEKRNSPQFFAAHL